MKRFLTILATLFCFIACRTPRYIYAPSAQNVPDLEEKNNAELSVNYGPLFRMFHFNANYIRALDVQSSWAATDHFALMFNYSNRWEKDNEHSSIFTFDTTRISYRRSFAEPAVGYFTQISTSGKMHFQVFGGAGFGYSDISDMYFADTLSSNRYHNSKVTKLFLQPAIIFKPSDNFRAALSMRFTEAIFNSITTNYTQEELDNYFMDSLESHLYFCTNQV